jgi:hypothetical protein
MTGVAKKGAYFSAPQANHGAPRRCKKHAPEFGKPGWEYSAHVCRITSLLGLN